MKHTLTVCYVTARHEPRVEWFLDSLWKQPEGPRCKIIIVDPFRPEGQNTSVRVVRPKPNIWNGPHRLPKEDWFNAGNARNTGLCLCETEWIAWVDDRSILLPQWLEAVTAAMDGLYVVCGPYEKVHNLEVASGGAVQMEHQDCGYTWDGKKTDGKDSRLTYVQDHYAHHKHLSNPYNAPGEWTYGCSLALPVEWALQVGGFSEDICGGLGMEDSVFGICLANNGFPIKYDLRLAMVEDRTPGKIGPTMRRTDKGEIGTPGDKSHVILAKLKGSKTSLNSYDIRQVRNMVLSGQSFPAPSASVLDWFDGQPIKQMV